MRAGSIIVRMRPPQYAVVAYVTNAVGEFVEELRRETYPEHGHLPAHVTILPPRYIHGTEEQALETLEQLCREVQPFEIEVGEMASFLPVTPTVFIQVAHGAYRLRELHDRLNSGPFHCDECWPYMPHLTIVKVADEQQTRRAFDIAAAAWTRYRGPKRVRIDRLTFVREGDNAHWIDLAPVPLGGSLAPTR
jgi:2'-5' RNA ligase